MAGHVDLRDHDNSSHYGIVDNFLYSFLLVEFKLALESAVGPVLSELRG